MRLKLAKLQKSDKKALQLRATKVLYNGWININRMLHYQWLLFVSEII